MQRLIDILASSLGLILLAPVFIVIAVWIKLTSPGSVLYRATRTGRNGVPFALYKFRSMRTDADRIGSGITSAGDTRITPVGRFLRRSKLDELPQLINVLKGQMSLVGPRPEDPRFVEHYPEHLRDILKYRPGMTSPASIAFRNENSLLTGDNHEKLYIEQILPEKLRIDLAYCQSATVRSNMMVVLKTLL
ncbi:MAG: sugar transferase [Bacteroidia bacterium]|nr:sugar transferase [Bacteroidia bacterium]